MFENLSGCSSIKASPILAIHYEKYMKCSDNFVLASNLLSATKTSG
jgi:hypothetical protein